MINKPFPNTKKSTGYTLLELLVVLAILVLIVGIAAPLVLKQFGNAKTDTAKVQVNALAGNVEFFILDVGRAPTQDEGLGALVKQPSGVTRWRGPYIKKQSQLTDPWGNPYLYRLTSGNSPFEIVSLGADGEEGGEGEDKDVSSQE